MNKRIEIKNGINIAAVYSDKPIITDAQSALDLIATLQFCDDCYCLAINKEAIIEDFFKLSTGWRERYYKNLSTIPQ